MSQEKHKRIQILLPETLWQQATDKAFDTGCTGLSEYIRGLIRADLEKKPKRGQGASTPISARVVG